MYRFRDSFISEIAEKVNNGIRLTFEDGVNLFNSKDLLGTGYLANIVREQKNSDNTYFINNRHINYTNICINRCRFCAFSKDSVDPDAYWMSIEEVLNSASKYKNGNVSEFHIVGGLHPDLSIEYYIDMLGALHDRYPDVHLQAFTAVEIAHIADIAGLSVKETLIKLKEAGLGSIPGGGAEVFSEKLRKEICPQKISGADWMSIMETAHSLGIHSNATMLYGHIESVEDRARHLIMLRELQDRTNGFMSFIPLAFHPKNTDLGFLSGTSGYVDLKVLAVSRLMLDNFQHIKAFWIMIGTKLAQLSLSFGVDDLDGTVVEEKITHSAGAETEEFIEKEEIIRLIKDAGRIPVERDTLYSELKCLK